MSTLTLEEATDLTFDLADFGDATGDFNALPAPVPEGQKYVVDLGLGRNGIKPVQYNSIKGDDNSPKKTFFVMDAIVMFRSSEDGTLDPAFYQNIAKVRGDDNREYSSFTPKGKTLSGIQHVANLCEIDRNDFETTIEFLTAIERRLKTAPRPQALVTKLQWQWAMKVEGVTRQDGSPINWKVVKYGMKNAERDADGNINPVLYFAKDGTQVTKGTVGAAAVTASAVVTGLQKI